MSAAPGRDSLNTRAVLETVAGPHTYYSLPRLSEQGFVNVARLPFSIKVLLESVLRSEDGRVVTEADLRKLAGYDPAAPQAVEIPFKPARVILQDFTGVPAVVDLAAMRSAMARLGGDPQRINPQIPVDLVIDHSVQVDHFNSPRALEQNASMEFARNGERYAFLRWGQQALRRFRVVPPQSGIVHQVNLEYLAKVVQVSTGENAPLIFPDSLVGTDSHTTMINGLGILGWGVGGIEAEACMLGQPIYMLMPEVIGFRLDGKLPAGVTATDLVLVVTQMLRQHGVVSKFVEFYGPGLTAMSLPDRATIANMAPEYGATVGFFPVDEETLRYLRSTGRPEIHVQLTEQYCRAQGLFRTAQLPDPIFKQTLALDLSTVVPSLAGPKRPQDRIPLTAMKPTWQRDLSGPLDQRGYNLSAEAQQHRAEVVLADKQRCELVHGSVVIAAITSCTNTSNPSVMLCAGLLAKKAVEAGLRVGPAVKTSLAPGSKAVTSYLQRSGLLPYLEQLGFYLVGYGCTTCIGNSGPLPEAVARAVEEKGLVVAAVLSGNRNFEGRINPHVKANYLASPPLVVAYAIAGTMDRDLTREPLGVNRQGEKIFLEQLWPSAEEIAHHLDLALSPEIFRAAYAGIETGNERWNQIPVVGGALYAWDPHSSYIQEPPFFQALQPQAGPIVPIRAARALIKVGDSVTTDHISPAGSINRDSPAGRYLLELGVKREDFNSYGSRRGNDRVMTRGTFANIRLKNQLAPGTEGSFTTHWPSGEVVSIHQAALRYQQASIPTVVLAGQDYGMGSSRDWAAKGTFLLGVKVVLAGSFERIHRSNLVGMGVLPLQFKPEQNVLSLGLTGREQFSVALTDDLQPLQEVMLEVEDEAGTRRTIPVICRIDTPVEVEYYRNGGILQTVLRQLLATGT
jgi:aconitate hydratase